MSRPFCLTVNRLGGAGGSFFQAILAVEELSRVDASVGVFVDVQNTLVNNALLRWGTEEQKKRCLPKMASEIVGAYALSEAGSGSVICPAARGWPHDYSGGSA